jgi:hypothetical protein
MATTFYAPSSSWRAAPISPSTRGWSTNRPDFFRFSPWASVETGRPSLGNSDGGGGSFAGTNPSQECMFQMVWGPIQAVSVAAQTVSIGWMGHHGATFGFHWLRGGIWIAKPDGTLRGTVVLPTDATLFANNNSYPANTPYSSRFQTGTSLGSTVSALAGDYVIIEVGFENQSGSLMNSFLQLGDGNASDIDSTDSTTNRNPFVKFATTTFALAPTGVPNSLMMLGVGT